MKTAISIPDDTFERASRKAKALGMSRSEFFTRAAARYLDELDEGVVTEQIDAVLGAPEHRNASWDDAVRAGRGVLDDGDTDW